MDFKLPYEDVRAAWRHYLAHDNEGRRVVLIGHSQGARILARLIAHEIEGKPEQRLFAGALILGFDVEVPEGKDVGGTFKTIPLCRAAGQSGCIVAYETFPATSPPPDDAHFTHPETPGMEIACTDPAALADGTLDPIFATQTNLLGKSPGDPGWAAFVKPLETPFVSLPGIASGHCVKGTKASYFSVSINASPAPDTWPATLPGNLVVDGRILKGWGWHLIDFNIAMGNLIDFVVDVAIAPPVAQIRRPRPVRRYFPAEEPKRCPSRNDFAFSSSAQAECWGARSWPSFRRAMTSCPPDRSRATFASTSRTQRASSRA